MKRGPLIVLAIAIAGCGGGIDGDALEADIEEDFQREGLVVDAVDCPSPATEDGDRFDCTVTVKGEERSLEITQRGDDGSVEYDLGAILSGTEGGDAGGDEASIRFVIDAINRDVTALCDYATRRHRRQLAKKGNCATAVLTDYDRLLTDYEVSVNGDAATASDAKRSVKLERQEDGSWLVTDVK